MISACKQASTKIADLEALNTTTIGNTVSDFQDKNIIRLLVTDENAMILFDTNTTLSISNKYALLPEIIKALDGNDVFYSKYHDGGMQSAAATPIYAYGTQIGCVYLLEYDTEQGALIASLQKNILAITIIFELIVIFFSLLFSKTYSARLKKIMVSIRNVRKGDYSHKLEMGGDDELNALGDEFNDLISRLQTSEEKRNRFVSDASHELKTPLASIKLLSDSILQNNMDTQTVREFVSDIGNEADRLNRMSHKLLSLSRADAQPENLGEIILIAPTIQRVIRMLTGTANDNNVNIEHNLEDECSILASEDDLYQIIFNLVENGIKYNRENGLVTIKLYQENDCVCIQIKDTGVGIPEESLNHIFERFYRVDKARSRKTGGSGLGLSIVRSMVERNNGKICVESEINQGTMFTISFPAVNRTEDAQ